MNFKTLLFVVLVLVGGSFLSSTLLDVPMGAFAQEDAGADAPKSSGGAFFGMTMGELLAAGATIGWMIMFLSVIMFSLAIQYGMQMRRDKLVPPDVLGELEVLFEDEDYEGAMELCESEPCLLTNVIAAALPKIAFGFDVMVESMRAVQEEEAVKLNQKVGSLSLIGALAPMLGLLGTVTGMIAAFNQIASSPTAPKPSELAGGISQALVTTMQGLFVAIPAISCFFYLKNQVAKSALEVAAIAEELVERFRPTPE